MSRPTDDRPSIEEVYGELPNDPSFYRELWGQEETPQSTEIVLCYLRERSTMSEAEQAVLLNAIKALFSPTWIVPSAR